MGTAKANDWAFTENFYPEDHAMVRARSRGRHLGVRPQSPGTGAALRLFAAASGAKSVVQMFGGAGVESLWLMAGMRSGGTLTCIEPDPVLHHACRTALREGGHAPNQFRLISSEAQRVLPRLTNDAYDMAVLDARAPHLTELVEQGIRVVRPGGLLVVCGVFLKSTVPNPADRDPQAVAARKVLQTVRGDERLTPALLPAGDGLLAAVKKIQD